MQKRINLTQKQLAEKLNVTDKAVSKWETGKGAPDISILTTIADTLNITVIELLEGEYLEKSNAQSQTEKVVIKALQKAKKERIKTLLSIFSTLVILFSLVNIIAYAYWGNRHKVLYDVDTVYVHQSEDNENIYNIYYNCSVKNWWFDFNEHTYNLVLELGGEPGSWSFTAKTDSVTSTNISETFFVIYAELDTSTITGTKPGIKEIIKMSQFSAYDDNDKPDERATLYMSDFRDVKIIMI